MKIRMLIGSLLFLFSSLLFASTALQQQSVAGYWQTFDGKTKKPSSIIHVFSKNGLYFGKIIKGFKIAGENNPKVCLKCEGRNHDKQVIGMTIIHNMICNSERCHNGTILDPRNGDVYHASMQLIHNGAYMKVRGYIGMPLFGKTVVWQRVAKP